MTLFLIQHTISAVKRFFEILLSYAFVLLLPVCVVSCSKKADTQPKKAEFFTYFDTVVSVYSYADENNTEFEKNTEDLKMIFDRYNRLLDIYNSYSGINNLCTINENAGKEPVEVDYDLIEFLLWAKKMYETTGGETDITMGSVLSLWHDARYADIHYLPDADALKEASLHTGFDKLEINELQHTVLIKDPYSSLDAGALGKGYAAEKAAQYLEEKGIDSYVLNLGGNVRLIGSKPGKEDWVVGIKDPSDPGNIAVKISCSNTSCVTSGAYERYFEFNGVRYSHVIDRDSLFPSANFESVSVITQDSGLADALSTALFCMSYEDGLVLVQSLQVQCIWIFNDGSVKYTDGLKIC